VSAAGKTEEKGKPLVQVFAERNPQIVRLEQPVFPPEALAASGSADVIIMVQIDPDGKPVKSLIAKSSNDALNPAITAAAMNSVYRAGSTVKGPATKWITIPFQVK
jgi:outer membrane biosynthesis protein TonB